MQSRWSFPSHRLERVATAVKKPARRSRARVKRWYSFSAMASGGCGHQEINPNTPADDLERRDDDGENISDFRPMDNTARRVPVTNRHIQRHRRGDDGEIKDEQRINGQRQGNAVVEGTMVFQAFDFS